MARKKVLVLIRHSPFNTIKGAEALRQSVGLTMNNDVTVVLLDAGVWLGVLSHPEAIGMEPVKKHLDTLPLMHARVKAEEESLRKFGIDPRELRAGIEVIAQKDLLDELASSEVIIPF